MPLPDAPFKVKLEFSNHFLKQRKKFTKNNADRLADYKKTVTLFVSNSNHPGLNTEKLQDKDIYTLRLNKSDRIFFIWKEQNSAIFIDIGKHDKYRKL